MCVASHTARSVFSRTRSRPSTSPFRGRSLARRVLRPSVVVVTFQPTADLLRAHLPTLRVLSCASPAVRPSSCSLFMTRSLISSLAVTSSIIQRHHTHLAFESSVFYPSSIRGGGGVVVGGGCDCRCRHHPVDGRPARAACAPTFRHVARRRSLHCLLRTRY
ncbi:hypothetical protein EXIGLDRAFT_725074 [Exidia glandulosa HHB12029]|uniref:Uncharacterized protein n=1 Tax=Exidia glandulosa HHB12029 TaxID=1314781 RepID=A0A165ZW92_EXIGL|nr:hypothetical protein EXIGLDRAFT_725074 [Exidia glandulosa HHB12029]